MKLNLFAALIAGAMLCLAPGEISAPAQTTPISSNTPSGPVQLSGQDLQQLVAPIALYPDPLLALILQGSTVPTDIVLASRWLADGNSADNIDAQPWDDSVKGLARYPDVLQMMDENLDWTNQLGAAVLAQQADVMTAVQAMRAKAQTLGNLETTAQQQVIDQDNVIQIVPADPQVIYVPTYDPTVIYYQPAPPIIFGPAFTIGIWLGGGCDWYSHRFYRGGFYRPGYGWGYRPGNGIIWRPNPQRPPPRPPYRPGKPGNLPGWRPPPGGGRPGQPGKPRPPNNGPGKPGNPGNRPGGPGNRPGQPGNRPGIPENRPNRPTNPPGQPGNRPGTPGNRPGNGPSIQPVKPPGNQNPNRPGTRPTRPQKPEQPSIQPVKPQPRPSPSQPSARPAPRPPSHDFNRGQPSSKPRPAVQPSRPAATRPAPSRPAPSRPAPQRPSRPAAAPNRGGGGGGRGGPSNR